MAASSPKSPGSSAEPQMKKPKVAASSVEPSSTSPTEVTLQGILYTFIVRQLQDDGHVSVARALSKKTGIYADLSIENHKLASIVQEHVSARGGLSSFSAGSSPGGARSVIGSGLNQDNEAKTSESVGALPDGAAVEALPKYDTRFITTHKQGVSVARFSRDGAMVATGSEDTSIKVLDVAKMHFHSQFRSERSDAYKDQSRPVIRTYYDHDRPVTDLDFHPTKQWLLSSSLDCTVKIFDTTKKHNKRSRKCIKDTHPVCSIHTHGGGEYLLVGTEHPMIRIYSLTTMDAFVSSDVNRSHFGPITSVRYNDSCSLYASASRDGNIRIWDTATNKCVRSIDKAHSGASVSSVRFSADEQWLLSGGADGISRLWHVGSGRQMMRYDPTNNLNLRLQTEWDQSGNFVFTCDEKTHEVVAWNAWTGERVQGLKGHNKPVVWVAVSPTEPALMTCSQDFRARFWTSKSTQKST